MNGGGNTGLQPASTPCIDNDYSTMSRACSLLDPFTLCPGLSSKGICEFLEWRWVHEVMLLCAGDMAKPKMVNKQMVMIDWAGCVLVYRVRCYVFES